MPPRELPRLALDYAKIGQVYEVHTPKVVYSVAVVEGRRGESELIRGLMIHANTDLRIHTSPHQTYALAVIEVGRHWAINGVSTREPVTRIVPRVA